MTSRTVRAVLLAGLLGGAAIGCDTGSRTKPAANAQPTNAPATATARLRRYDLAAVAGDAREGFENTATALAQNFHSASAPRAPVFQRLPEVGASNGPLVVVVESKAAPMPEACALESGTVELCDQGICRAFNGRDTPLVLCSGRIVALMQTLMHLEHAFDGWQASTSSDVEFISLLARAESDPAAVLRDFQPQFPPGHIARHWTLLATFLVGRELALAATPSPTASSKPGRAKGAELSDAEFCRQFAAPDAEKRVVSQEQSAADRAGADDVRAALSAIASSEGGAAARNGADDFTGDIFLLALTLWYRQVAAFEQTECSRSLPNSFRLTRCFCGLRAAAWLPAARSLLLDASESLLFRGPAIIDAVWSKHVKDVTVRSIFNAVMLDSLRNGATKLSQVACARQGFIRLDGLGDNVMATLPALEGSRDSAAGPANILWPTSAQDQELLEYCTAHPATDVAPANR